MEDIRTCCIQLLVAEDGQLCGRLCERLWPLQFHEKLSSIPTGKLMLNQIPDHHWKFILVDLIMETAPELRLWHHYGSSWSSIQMSSHHTDHIWSYCCQSSPVILGSHMETPWSTRRSDQWLGNTICIKLHLISESAFRDLSSSFHSLSPTDGQTDQEGQPRGRTIPLTLHEPTPRWLVWITIHCWVCL